MNILEICDELDIKAVGSSCDSIADKLLVLVTSMPTAFITKPTSDLEQVWVTVLVIALVIFSNLLSNFYFIQPSWLPNQMKVIIF